MGPIKLQFNPHPIIGHRGHPIQRVLNRVGHHLRLQLEHLAQYSTITFAHQLMRQPHTFGTLRRWTRYHLHRCSITLQPRDKNVPSPSPPSDQIQTPFDRRRTPLWRRGSPSSNSLRTIGCGSHCSPRLRVGM